MFSCTMLTFDPTGYTAERLKFFSALQKTSIPCPCAENIEEILFLEYDNLTKMKKACSVFRLLFFFCLVTCFELQQEEVSHFLSNGSFSGTSQTHHS